MRFGTYRKENAERKQIAIFTNSFLLQILNLLKFTEILAPNFDKISNITTQVCLPKFIIKISVNFNIFDIFCYWKGLVKSTKFLRMAFFSFRVAMTFVTPEPHVCNCKDLV
jgi:hypothetical protein